MKIIFHSILIILLANLLSCPNLNAQYIQHGEKIIVTGINQFGMSSKISTDGKTAIIGTYNKGSYIFSLVGNSWIEEANLIGTGNVGEALQGTSVSLSADGNTAIIGGYADNNGIGAAWIFTRTGMTWAQQGDKLVGTGYTGQSNQGSSVSLSADGNTATIGGVSDNNGVGAVWVFIRSGSSWTQQGKKLTGSGNVGQAHLGYSVSLSSDGNYLAAGGYSDNNNAGAAWIFNRTSSTWTQQGNKLVGTGSIGQAYQGTSVSLSGDGNSAIIGGYADNTNMGAAWIFNRTGTSWSQQGDKLVGTGNEGKAHQGLAVSLSADGNTAIVGGCYDNDSNNYSIGASWIFIRSESKWLQSGEKVVGSGNIGQSLQGNSVSLSGNGNIALVSGNGDKNATGAAWIFDKLTLANVDSELEISELLILIPNPNSGRFRFSDQSVIKDLSIYDYTGKLIEQYNKIPSTFNVNYSKGIYILRINTDKGYINRRMVIE